MWINITGLKRQLHIELDNTDDDIILQSYCDAAEKSALNYCDVKAKYNGTRPILSGTTFNISYIYSGYTGNVTDVDEPILNATYLIAANAYVNRQPISFSQGVEIPYTLKWLLDPYRNFFIV